jgi:hypothetical protein
MVPFEQLGSGQIGRLAYQVIGKEGPIFNPNNIAFLPPEDAPGVTQSLSDAAVGLAGLNLAATIGTLALSAITYRQLSKLRDSVSVLARIASATKKQVDEIAKRVERIDMRVAENNLRAAMRHVLQQAAHQDNIDLSKLLPLRSDIRSFIETLNSPIYFNFGVRFASDVRDNLQAICSLLANLRWLIATRHNIVAAARPNRVVTYSYALDLRRALRVDENIRSALAFARLDDAYADVHAAVRQSVSSRFTFADSSDLQHFSELLQTRLSGAIVSLAADILPEGNAIYRSLPEALFEGTIEEVAAKVNEAAATWMSSSDSALLLRVDLELEALELGYEKIFWPHLLDAPASSIGSVIASVDIQKLQMRPQGEA